MKLESNRNDLIHKIANFNHHFFILQDKNDHNLAMLAPINLYLTPFYSSCVSDSVGIIKNHVSQNGHHVPLLHSGDTAK